MFSKTVFAALVLIAIACYAHAETYNEDAFYKDYVNIKDEDVVLAINRDTNQVELYWSQKDNSWLKPDAESQKELQKVYNKKLRMMQQQKEMDRMHADSWYNTSQGPGGRR